MILCRCEKTNPISPGRSHIQLGDTCDLPTYLGILLQVLLNAPGTVLLQHGCSSLSAFQPCFGATLDADLVKSGTL